MKTSVSFSEVCSYVKGNQPKDLELLSAVDKLLGISLVFTTLSGADGYTGAIALLTTKNELVKAGKSLLDFLCKKEKEGIDAQYHRMSMAYCLIAYTSFFDGLESFLDDLMQAYSLQGREDLVEAFLDVKLHEHEGRLSDDDGNLAVAAPYPTEGVDEYYKDVVSEIHKEQMSLLAQRVFSPKVQNLCPNNEEEFIDKQLAKYATEVKSRYEQQYYELNRQFPDFRTWSSIIEHREVTAGLQAISGNLSELYEELQGIKQESTRRNHEAMSELAKIYLGRVEEPVAKELLGDLPRSTHQLPTKQNTFIPQRFRFARVRSAKQPLDDEVLWSALPERSKLVETIGAFLESPYSNNVPLIVLGNPGSGKSLLTEILAASPPSVHLMPIRVVLRDVDAEAEIESQIEQQIKSDTTRKVDWAELRSKLTAMPLIIFDGYDELLQTSGQAHSNYIVKVSKFQQREAFLGRPVKSLLTSRLNLISKAAIPLDSLVIRLLPFNSAQKQQWISKWNSLNNFVDENSKFGLPDDAEVTRLAEEPLLLFMLALFDFGENKIAHRKFVNRSQLYDDLLRKFVEREQSKPGTVLRHQDEDDPIETAMCKLRVAALGMFNRKSLHISAGQLDSDLEHFALEQPTSEKARGALSKAELVIGSFFFVHESLSSLKAGTDQHSVRAFEFMHNTFNEFLVADMIVHELVEQAQTFVEHQTTERLKASWNNRLHRAELFPTSWYSCLIHTALFDRSVVLDMISEWAPLALKRHGVSLSDFTGFLDVAVESQLDWLLELQEVPPAMYSTTYRVTPSTLIEHLATYSINLVVLKVVLDEKGLGKETHSTNCPVNRWEKLTHLWRTTFPLELLAQLSNVWAIDFEHDRLVRRRRDRSLFKFDKHNAIPRASYALDDRLLSTLNFLYTVDPAEDEELAQYVQHICSSQDDFALLLNIKTAHDSKFLLNRDADRVPVLKQINSKISAAPTFDAANNALNILYRFGMVPNLRSLKPSQSIYGIIDSIGRYSSGTLACTLAIRPLLHELDSEATFSLNERQIIRICNYVCRRPESSGAKKFVPKLFAGHFGEIAFTSDTRIEFIAAVVQTAIIFDLKDFVSKRIASILASLSRPKTLGFPEVQPLLEAVKQDGDFSDAIINSIVENALDSFSQWSIIRERDERRLQIRAVETKNYRLIHRSSRRTYTPPLCNIKNRGLSHYLACLKLLFERMAFRTICLLSAAAIREMIYTLRSYGKISGFEEWNWQMLVESRGFRDLGLFDKVVLAYMGKLEIAVFFKKESVVVDFDKASVTLVERMGSSRRKIDSIDHLTLQALCALLIEQGRPEEASRLLQWKSW